MPQDPLPLWPAGIPGTVVPGQEQHERAKEVPHLLPFLLPGEQVRPLVVVCPGGGYGGRAPHEADPIALWLNGLGLHAVVCHYRVFPWRHPQPLHDAQRAIRLVRHRAAAWKVDPGRIGIVGFSAGGHLVCSTANFGDDGDPTAADPVARQSSRVNALIACYPVITNANLKGHQGSFTNLLGSDPDPALWRRMSLENSVTTANPPTFIMHTADDPVVPLENALVYAGALRAAQVPVALHVYPHAPHGIGLGRDFPGSARRWTADCEAWLHELGWA